MSPSDNTFTNSHEFSRATSAPDSVTERVISSRNSGFPRRSLSNLPRHIRRQRFVHGDLPDEGLNFPRTQSVELNFRDIRPRLPRWLELWPRGKQRHQSGPLRRGDQLAQQFNRGRVGPMEILKNEQGGAVLCEPRQPRNEDLHCSLARAHRRQVWRGPSCGIDGDGENSRDERHGLGRVDPPFHQPLRDALHPFVRRGALEPEPELD